MRMAGTRPSVSLHPSLQPALIPVAQLHTPCHCPMQQDICTCKYLHNTCKRWLMFGVQSLLLWSLRAMHCLLCNPHGLHPAGYLDACGGGLHLQIGRTVSIDKTLGKASLHRDGSASFMLESDSLQEEVRARCPPARGVPTLWKSFTAVPGVISTTRCTGHQVLQVNLTSDASPLLWCRGPCHRARRTTTPPAAWAPSPARRRSS